MKLIHKIKGSPRFIRLTQWEYWPIAAFYGPVIPYYVYLSLKAGHPFFYTAANPAIEAGGSGFESKYSTILLLPPELAPKTLLVPKDMVFSQVPKSLQELKISFPLIAKPDVGFRGLLVEKVKNIEQLKKHIQQNKIDFILQEFIASPIEFSVFYHKIPGHQKGRITSLTIKEFLQIEGDGKTAFGNLLSQKPRAKIILDALRLQHEKQWDTVVKKGKSIKVVEIGNHARGSRFINGNHLIDKDLCAVFEKLSKQIPGWNYGRVDIRCASIEALKKGDFKIIEINGVLAEPTHIYDASKTNYFTALKDIAHHWKILYQVSTNCHKQNGIAYPKFKEYVQSLLNLRKYVKNLQ